MIDTSEAIRRLMEAPEFEVLPFSSALDQMEFLPKAATVTVTSSPAKGLEATVEYAVQIAGHGFNVVPHLAARAVADEAHLISLLDAIEGADINRVFVVGGDNEEPGAFPDGLSLIQAMERLGRLPATIGVPAYPDGHAFIPEDALLQALKDKQPYAAYMTTQMCFDPDLITRWVHEMRREGITLPVHLGMPGVAPLTKLIRISTQIGVGQSVKFLSKHKGLLGALTRRDTYSPDDWATGLGEVIADPEANIEALHFYTFNQVESCEAWRADFLAEIG